MRRRIAIATPIYLLVALLVWVSFANNASLKMSDLANAQAEISLSQDINKIQSKKKQYTGTPGHISIPRLGLKRDILPGEYNPLSQSWSLSDSAAHFATITNQLNNRKNGGLTLLYGHNTPEVLAQTTNLKPNDLVEIRTDNNLIFSYKYIDDSVVVPTDTSIFDYQGKSRLVIMSCTGVWNENRRLMNFELITIRESA